MFLLSDSKTPLTCHFLSKQLKYSPSMAASSDKAPEVWWLLPSPLLRGQLAGQGPAEMERGEAATLMSRSSSITLIGQSGSCRPLGNQSLRATGMPGSIFHNLTSAVMEAAVSGRARAHKGAESSPQIRQPIGRPPSLPPMPSIAPVVPGE